MKLAPIDIAIVLVYVIVSVSIGVWISRHARENMRSYFLGGNNIPWYTLGLSNASGMFDISGTMWLVYLLFIYGLKSIFIPWVWPVFNQIFMMIFLSVWLRRSCVLTGAEWITFRFGTGRGARLSHIIIVVFALLNVLGFLAYGFIGIGKFAAGILPWELSSDTERNEIYYGLIITGLTAIYVVKGGMYSVVFTEVIQFFVMTLASIAVGVIAMSKVSPQLLASVVPDGWMSLSIARELDIDWSGILPSANDKIAADGMSLFSIFLMLALFKGVLQSVAGPAPNYDMQRILSAKSPHEAAKMSCFVNVVLFFPRYMLITGLTILALAFFLPELKAMGPNVDFEQILPFALSNFIPAGLLGLLIAGLLAAFMSTFAATTNAAPAYVVNDIYKRYINPNAEPKVYVRLSYLVSAAFIIAGTIVGLFIPSLNEVVMWIVGALYGGYTAANLLKWVWWRFNGYGYFFGMLAGILGSLVLVVIEVSPLKAFPAILLLCLAGCIFGSLCTEPEDMEVLKNFYKRTRPWGFWTPVYDELKRSNPDIEKNHEFFHDLANVFVGILWQTSFVAAPIFLVIQQWQAFLVVASVSILTSLYLKKFWYDKLHDYPDGVEEIEHDLTQNLDVTDVGVSRMP